MKLNKNIYIITDYYEDNFYDEVFALNLKSNMDIDIPYISKGIYRKLYFKSYNDFKKHNGNYEIETRPRELWFDLKDLKKEIQKHKDWKNNILN